MRSFMDKKELGSKTAKGGFANEQTICRKFNSWEKDKEAQEWLQIMGYNLNKIKSVKAIQIPVRIKKADVNKFDVKEGEYEEFVKYKKADAQIKIYIRIGDIIKIENLSLKKANRDSDYNQIDKRTVASYQEMWGFNEEISYWLKLFTGELNPEKEIINGNLKELKNIRLKDKRRLFFNEIPLKIQNKIINFLRRTELEL